MKLVMTLLVRDEEDIIESHIRFHLEQGVDFLIVCDNLSKDGTTEILREFEGEGVLRLTHERRDNYAQGRWVTRMARMAATVDRADWVINSDADEFWWPRAGSLKSVLAAVPASVGKIEVHRQDFVPVPDTAAPFHRRMTARKVVSLNTFGAPLPPKVIHRAHPRVIVAQGNHAVRWPRLQPLDGPPPIDILHFPIRTAAQFRNKISNGGAAYARNRRLSKRTGRGWRHLYELASAGGIEDHYREQEQDPAAIEAGIADGRYVLDERLRHFVDRQSPARDAPGA